MKALLWDGREARVVDRDVPAPSDGMALVRVSLAGVCDTDLQIVRGYMGFCGVLGHELIGTVESGPDAWKGRRVVGEINFACGICPTCRRGLGRHCPTRSVMGILSADGAFAESVAVPIANLHAVPDSVPDDAAVFTEPLAAAFNLLEQVHVPPGMKATVLGDGKLGLLVAQVLQRAGASVLTVGKHRDKLDILARRGIETTLFADWSRSPSDLVVEATGTAAGFETALGVTRPRGTLALKSTVADGVPLNLAPVVINEIQVVGSRCGPFEPALQALATDAIDVRSLIAERVPLERAAEALQIAGTKGTLKVLIENRRGG